MKTKKVSEKNYLKFSKLEVGSGNKPKEGYLHFDIRKLEGTDVVGDAKKLPFKNESFEEVYSRFFLEHLLRADAKKALAEMFRVLKKGGKITIIVPNLAHFCKLFLEGNSQEKEWALNKIYGFEKYVEDHHNFGYDEFILSQYLKDAGFSSILRVAEKEEQYLRLDAIKA